jgi:hypothetical protein
VASTAIQTVPLAAHHALRSLLQDVAENDSQYGHEISRRLFNIRSADTAGLRSSASILVKRMYATRGYRSVPLSTEAPPDRITLVASEHDATVATITIGFDSPAGLNVDTLFSAEANALRDAGHAVCEFTTLAMDSVVRSRRVLASLFHVAYLYAHRVKCNDFLLIEVNPRHVRYYQRMLGFAVVGPQRMSTRVHAPAVLMRLDFAHARAQIARFGGRPELVAGERSLYPDFFSLAEETAIVNRLVPARPVVGNAAHPRPALCLLQA